MSTYSNAMYNYKGGVFIPCKGINFRKIEQKLDSATGCDSASMERCEKYSGPLKGKFDKEELGKRKIPTVYTHSRPSTSKAMMERVRPENSDDDDDNDDEGKKKKKYPRSKIIF